MSWKKTNLSWFPKVWTFGLLENRSWNINKEQFNSDIFPFLQKQVKGLIKILYLYHFPRHCIYIRLALKITCFLDLAQLHSWQLFPLLFQCFHVFFLNELWFSLSLVRLLFLLRREEWLNLLHTMHLWLKTNSCMNEILSF